jgi:hypothetical protein
VRHYAFSLGAAIRRLSRGLSFQAEAFSFHFDDPALGLYLVSDILGGLQVGYVDGAAVLTAVSCRSPRR